MAFDDIDNYLSRYTDRDRDDDPEERVCMGCGRVDCECDDDPTPDDCLDCGTCEHCIDRTISAAEDHDLGGES